MKHQKFCFILFILWGAVAPLCAQLRLTVEAPSSVDINDSYFQIRYKIASASVEGIEPMTFKDFDLLSGPNISIGHYSSSINGHVQSSQSTTYTFTLAPRTRGTFTIPPAVVRVGGKSYRSSSVKIQVRGSGNRQPQQQRSSSSGGSSSAGYAPLREVGSAVSEKDLYLVARLGRREVYEQEAVPLVYEFYERPGVGLNSVGLSQKPDFKGIVSQEIPIKNIDSRLATVDGQTYRNGVVQQYVLFPQQTGELKIPSLTFDCVVMQRLSEMDYYDIYFNSGSNIGKTLKRNVAEQTLTVKPLPLPKPQGFSGGVGQFQVKVGLLTNEVRTNDLVTYRLTVSGTGNLKLLSAPAIAFPSDFDTYSPKTTDKTNVTMDGVSGEISFDYTFVPRNTGQYEIPEMAFSYFDPASENYKTILVPAVKMDIKKGERSEADLEHERALRNSDIHPIHDGETVLKPAEQYYWWGQLSYWGTYVLAVLLFGTLMFVLRRYLVLSADTARSRRHKAAKWATKRLKVAKVALEKGDNETFFAELSKSLAAYLSDKLNISIAELRREEQVATLAAHGVDETTIAAWQQLQEDCAYARFAPATSDVQPATYYQRAVDLITTFEHQLATGKSSEKQKQSNEVDTAYDTK